MENSVLPFPFLGDTDLLQLRFLEQSLVDRLTPVLREKRITQA